VSSSPSRCAEPRGARCLLPTRACCLGVTIDEVIIGRARYAQLYFGWVMPGTGRGVSPTAWISF
jgi:hypothetical protein